jgi:hypothetical protein
MTPERFAELRREIAEYGNYESGFSELCVAECLDDIERLQHELNLVLGSPSLKVSAEVARARQSEIERLQNVLKLTDEECLVGGFCRGIAIRKENEPLTEFDREMLTIAGKCIARIINHQEAK